MRRLIVNADDYGRSPAISRGILRAHREGVVTSTTVMIGQAGVEEQLVEALLCPGLGIGLHLVCTSWRPTLPPGALPDLVDVDGLLLDQYSLWAVRERVLLAQIEAELEAQWARFVTLAGRPPSHLDAHQYWILYPPFCQAYVELAARHDVPLRVPYPLDIEPALLLALAPFLAGVPHEQITQMMSADISLVRENGLRHPDRFVYTFFGRERLRLDNLFRLLRHLGDGTSELMCHPGYMDERASTSAYRSEREIELALLTDPAVRQLVADSGIELVTFGTLNCLTA